MPATIRLIGFDYLKLVVIAFAVGSVAAFFSQAFASSIAGYITDIHVL